MTIPTCCVTGAIPGDGGACGDCDPCIMGEPLVPQPVKAIIAEKNSLLNQIGELKGKIEAIEDLRSAFAKARCSDIEIVMKDGGLWPGATGMHTNSPPTMVVAIYCGASQVKAREVMLALKAFLQTGAE